jgi:hypothetical protein
MACFFVPVRIRRVRQDQEQVRFIQYKSKASKVLSREEHPHFYQAPQSKPILKVAMAFCGFKEHSAQNARASPVLKTEQVPPIQLYDSGKRTSMPNPHLASSQPFGWPPYGLRSFTFAFFGN